MDNSVQDLEKHKPQMLRYFAVNTKFCDIAMNVIEWYPCASRLPPSFRLSPYFIFTAKLIEINSNSSTEALNLLLN